MATSAKPMTFPKPVKDGPKPRKRIARKRRPRAERKTPLARLKRQCDALWSLRIRERDVFCQVKRFGVATTQCNGALQADHIFGRKRLRWLLEGGAAICSRHHILVTYSQANHALLGVRKLGPERYLVMLERANNDRGRATIKRPDVEAAMAAIQEGDDAKL